MATIFNKPRVIPFNPDSPDIVLDDNTKTDTLPTYSSSAPQDLELPNRNTGSVDNTGNSNSVNDQILQMLMHPDTSNIDRMNSMVDQFPVRNKPSMLRKIFGGIEQGLGGGPGAYEHVAYGPYERQLEDWQAKFRPIEQAAGIERQNNANLRMVGSSILSNDIRDKNLQRQISADAVRANQGDRRLGITESHNAVTEGQTDRRLGQTDEQIALQQELANGGVLHVDDQGNPFLITRKGEKVPVDANYLSAEQKNAMKIQVAAASAGARAKATAANSKHRVVQGKFQDPNDPNKTVEGSMDLDTGVVTPFTIGNPKQNNAEVATAPKTELDKSRALITKANSVRLSNPAWAKYIKVDTTNKDSPIDITRPGTFNYVTPEMYNQMYQAIYGTAPAGDTSKNPATNNTTKPEAPKQNNTNTSTPPPVEKRTKGMRFTWANGNVGEWDGTKWVPITVVKR